MNQAIRQIIFDYGGTLDTNGVHWGEKFWEAYEHFRIPVGNKEFRDAFIYSEQNIPDVIRPDFSLGQTYETQLLYQFRYLEGAGLLGRIDDGLVGEMSRFCLKSVMENTVATRPTLALLEKKCDLGLISNYYGNVETVLKEMGLRQYFKSVVDSGAVGIRKPDRRIFGIALERMNGNPAETAVVGDSYGNDIAPAKELGCTTVWLKVKSWSNPEDAGSADVIITSIKDLPVALGNIRMISNKN